IYAIGIIGPTGRLRFSEGDVAFSCHTLYIGVFFQPLIELPGIIVIFIIKPADRREWRTVFYQQQGSIAHIKLLVQYLDGKIVVVIIHVFGMVSQVIIFIKSSEKGNKVIAGWYKDL